MVGQTAQPLGLQPLQLGKCAQESRHDRGDVLGAHLASGYALSQEGAAQTAEKLHLGCASGLSENFTDVR